MIINLEDTEYIIVINNLNQSSTTIQKWSRAQASSKWEASLWEEDIVWSI